MTTLRQAVRSSGTGRRHCPDLRFPRLGRFTIWRKRQTAPAICFYAIPWEAIHAFL